MKKIKYICLLLIIIFLFLYISNILNYRLEIIKEKNQISYSINKEVSYNYKEIEEYYDMVLSIPQIKLKKGIYSKDDSRNNIDKNITIHELSDYPNTNNSNVIIYGHSGVGRKAFFNELIKLDTDSLVELYYNHVKYIYKIDNIYSVDKNNKIKVIRDTNKKTITLITCSQTNKNEQIVFIGYLIDEINY